MGLMPMAWTPMGLIWNRAASHRQLEPVLATLPAGIRAVTRPAARRPPNGATVSFLHCKRGTHPHRQDHAGSWHNAMYICSKRGLDKLGLRWPVPIHAGSVPVPTQGPASGSLGVLECP